jgi:hypothetical protein
VVDDERGVPAVTITVVDHVAGVSVTCEAWGGHVHLSPNDLRSSDRGATSEPSLSPAGARHLAGVLTLLAGEAYDG